MPIGFMPIGGVTLVAALMMAVSAMKTAFVVEGARVALAMLIVFMEWLFFRSFGSFGTRFAFFMERSILMEVIRFMEGTEFLLFRFRVGIGLGQNRRLFRLRLSRGSRGLAIGLIFSLRGGPIRKILGFLDVEVFFLGFGRDLFGGIAKESEDVVLAIDLNAIEAQVLGGEALAGDLLAGKGTIVNLPDPASGRVIL